MITRIVSFDEPRIVKVIGEKMKKKKAAHLPQKLAAAEARALPKLVTQRKVTPREDPPLWEGNSFRPPYPYLGGDVGGGLALRLANGTPIGPIFLIKLGMDEHLWMGRKCMDRKD